MVLSHISQASDQKAISGKPGANAIRLRQAQEKFQDALEQLKASFRQDYGKREARLASLKQA